jgi:hypothetical protein
MDAHKNFKEYIATVIEQSFLSARKADLKKGFQHLVLVLVVLVVVLWTQATSGSPGCSG